MASEGTKIAPARYADLRPGDLAPWFVTPSLKNPRYMFHSVAGRWVLLVFLGSAGHPAGKAALQSLRTHRALFDDDKLALFCVTSDPADPARVRDDMPGWRWLIDPAFEVARLYGCVPTDLAPASGGPYRTTAFLLDPMLRVARISPLSKIRTLLEEGSRLPAVDAHAGVEMHAPVLQVPRVFDPEHCSRLIALHAAGDAEDSGFMREIEGKTRRIIDHEFKRRSDVPVRDPGLRRELRLCLKRRLLPLVQRAFQGTMDHIERDLVACYDSDGGGYFNAHRDNTTKGTAHRRFAVSINLNAEDYEGGELIFPEFGSRRYAPPTGGALVFSCSLLHRVLPVRSGRRYAYLPFLYDAEGAELRMRNTNFLEPG